MDKKVKVITCGCRFNRYESAEIEQQLGSQGKPIVVINSCAVTARSEAKSRAAVRRAVRENPDASIVVSGCWAELEPEAVGKLAGVNLVLGNEEKLQIENYTHTTGSHTGGVKTATVFKENLAGQMQGRTVRYLKVQNGCDELCSFCVVRLARGKSRSATAGFLLQRVAELIKNGAGEVVLTGINIGQYGHDLSDSPNFAQLLRQVSQENINYPVRFRISSINPTEVTEELLDVMAESPNICRYLHIPMQSGSTQILSAMRRPYRADEYRQKIEMVATKLPNLALGCDIMAGFPTEGKAEFAESATLLKELPFTYAHVFPYSHRKMADSAALPQQVSERDKKERANVLKQIAEDKNMLFRQNLIGKQQQVLVERFDSSSGKLNGKSDSFINVEFAGDRALLGKLVTVDVTAIADKGLIGSLA